MTQNYKAGMREKDMSSVLKVVGVLKQFPGVRALDGVSLDVQAGEVLGLIGENGAGKSTLLKIINGIYPHSSFEGNIYIEDQEVKLSSPHDALLHGIGFVPQETNVMDVLTVAENIFVGHITDGGKNTFRMRDLFKKAEAFLDQYNIRLDPKMNANLLSIGQKQLLMIARALSWEPKILILDEPTTALSQEDVEKLFEIVRTLKQKGVSIVFVTHKLEEIMELTDRVTVLRDGRYIDTYAKEAYDKGKIIAAMVGRSISSLYPARNAAIGKEVLRLEGVTVDHPRIEKRTLINDVSFSVHAGEVVGLAGLVGAGRTETVETIFGQHKLMRGEIYLNGEKTSIANEADAIAKGIAFLTEDRKKNGLLMLSDIKNNIVFGNLADVCSAFGINARKVRRVADTYMQSLKIKAPSSDFMVANLSGGNQQKVVLAKALNTNPKILILDEPTKGIDVGAKNEIYQMINQLAEQGIAVIFISSELPELLGMCDRFVVMAHGTTVGEIAKEEATQESIMHLCFA